MSITDIVDGVIIKVAADAPNAGFSGMWDKITGALSPIGEAAQKAVGAIPAPTAPIQPDLPDAGAPTFHTPSGVTPPPEAVAAPAAPPAPEATPPVAPAAPPVAEPLVAPAALPVAKPPVAPAAPKPIPGLATNEQGLPPAQIAKQRAEQYKTTHPDAISRAADSVGATLDSALGQLSSAAGQVASSGPVGAVVNKLKTQFTPQIVAAATKATIAHIDLLNEGNKSGASVDDFLGNIKERWGNIAVPLGLALMFFGGKTGMLAGGLLAAAGGANIYGRIQAMGQPSTAANMQKMSALKAQGITPWTQQAYDALAKAGTPQEEISHLRDVHALTVFGGVNTAYQRVLAEAEKRVAQYTNNNPEALKQFHDGVTARIREVSQPAAGSESTYAGTERGWMDKAMDWAGMSDSRRGLTSPPPAPAPAG